MTKPPLAAGLAGQPASAGYRDRRLRQALAALCITEITSWGTLYYAFPVLLAQLTHATGWRQGTALDAFSLGMVVSGVAGVPVGRLLILAAGSVTVALLAAAAVARQSAALLTVAILTGAARGSYTLLQATTISDRWGTRNYAALNGIYSAPATLAIAIAPAGGGWLAARAGGYANAFCVLAVLILLGAASAAVSA